MRPVREGGGKQENFAGIKPNKYRTEHRERQFTGSGSKKRTRQAQTGRQKAIKARRKKIKTTKERTTTNDLGVAISGIIIIIIILSI